MGWESAVWEWASMSKGQNVIMNEYVKENGYGEGIFLITQYFINGYLSSRKYPDFDRDLASIRKGEAKYQYDWEKNTLCVNDSKYPLPNNYADRLEKYEKAIDYVVGEQ